MKTPNVGDVVTVIHPNSWNVAMRATVKKSYNRRFIASVRTDAEWEHESYSFECADEGKTWVRGWDDETAIAFRAEKALAACR